MTTSGWLCPKCGRVWAPTTVGCQDCNNKASNVKPGTEIYRATPVDVPPPTPTYKNATEEEIDEIAKELESDNG